MSEPKNDQSETKDTPIDRHHAVSQTDAKADSESETVTPQTDDVEQTTTVEPRSAAQESDTVVPPADDDVATQLGNAQAEIAKFKDAFLRAKAEEENIRRRAEKDMAMSRKFAIEGFAKELLTVRDSLSLACSVELTEEADDVIKSIREGVEITLKQLDSVFTKFSLTEIAPKVGDKLDPKLHQAMSIIESKEVAAGSIINVIQSGFSLHERLLRPAMVVVAKA